GVERRAPLLGRCRRMCGDAAETELAGDVGEIRARARVVAVGGMPRYDRVDVAEESGADHVHLARAAFFRGRAVVAQRARMPGGQPLLDRDGRGEGSGAEQIVSAAMAGAVLDDCAAPRGRLLRKARQRVELAEDGDDRLA